MNKTTILAAGLCAAVLSPLAGAAELKTEKDRVSYAYGAMAAMTMQLEGAELDTEVVVQAIRDALGDGQPAMSRQEIFDAINRSRAARGGQQDNPTSADSQSNLTAGQDFLARNGKREGVVTLPSGLQYEVLAEGSGRKPGLTDIIEAHYTGTLIDGTKFDSSHDRGKPATFRVDRVIKGWTEALQLMQEGSKWKLYIPSDLAYGPRQVGNVIKPHSTLVFEVELLKVK